MDYWGGGGGGGNMGGLLGGGAGLPSSYVYANKRTSQVKLHTAVFWWQ